MGSLFFTDISAQFKIIDRSKKINTCQHVDSICDECNKHNRG